MIFKSIRHPSRRGIVGVIGGSTADESTLSLAEELGSHIARMGHILVTGGGGGVMQAASKGAYLAGGLVVGILPNDRHDKSSGYPNEYVDIPVYTGLSDARNVIIAKTPDVIVAFRGALGTVSEIVLALKAGTPVISFEFHHCDALEQDPGFMPADTISGALRVMEKILGGGLKPVTKQ